MEKQESLFSHEVELGYMPKKECLKEPRQITIEGTNKAEYGFELVLYAGFCGNRRLYISNTQYTYLKNNKQKIKDNDMKIWVHCFEKGENKKKKMEYTAKISVDKEEWL